MGLNRKTRKKAKENFLRREEKSQRDDKQEKTIVPTKNPCVSAFMKHVVESGQIINGKM